MAEPDGKKGFRSGAHTWKSFNAEAIAISDWVDHTESAARYQLPFTVGDVIQVLEATEGWYKGILLETGERGVFPAAFFRLRPSEDAKDPVMRELHNVFREWSELLKSYYLERRINEFKILSERIKILISWNKVLTSPHTPPAALAKMKAKVLASIEEGRRMMGLDLLVRTPSGDIATEKNCGVIDLYRMHQEQDRRNVLANFSIIPRLGQENKWLAKGGSLIDEQIDLVLPLHHIMLEMVVFQCKISEPTELRFAIYNSQTKTFITEEYEILLTVNGMPADTSKIGRLKTVFTDIDEKDIMECKLHLICYLVRVGKMHAEKGGKDKAGQCKVRRPYACAVLQLNLSRLLEDSARPLLQMNLKNFDEVYAGRDPIGKLLEQRMIIYNTPQELSFPDLHEMVMKNMNVMEVPQSLGITVGLKLLLGEYPKISSRLPQLKDVVVSRRMGIQPGEQRNDFYVLIDSGEFSQDRKRTAKNVEITVTVRDNKGKDIDDVIIPGSGESPVKEWKSAVYYHCNTPRWIETFKLNIPPHKYPDYHIFFTIQHCTTSGKKNTSKAGWSYSFLRLTDFMGTIQRDGEHVLNTHKPQKADDPVYYLNDPQKVVIRKGEFLKIRTSLCSTQLTQHPGLLSLLNWRSHKHELADVLKRFTFVEQSEVMKFLPETFEAMFEVLHLNAQDEKVRALVYDALIFLLGLFAEDRALLYVNFRPILDRMLQSYEQYSPQTATQQDKQRHERFAHAHLYLVPCVKRCFMDIDKPHAKITPTLKALEYTMKFLIVSRIVYSKHIQNNVPEEDSFKKEMLEFFSYFNSIMYRNSPGLIGAQTLALKNFVSWFQGMTLLFTEAELALIIHEFISAASYSDKKQLNQAKLNVLKEIVNSRLFLHEESRYILIPSVVQQLRVFISYSKNPDELSEVIKTLCWIIEALEDREGSNTDVTKCLLTIMEDVIGLVECVESARLKLDAVICLLGILYLVEPEDFNAYLQSMQSEEKRAILLGRLISTLDLLIARTDIIPHTWFGISMFQYSTISQVIRMICLHLKKYPDQTLTFEERKVECKAASVHRRRTKGPAGRITKATNAQPLKHGAASPVSATGSAAAPSITAALPTENRQRSGSSDKVNVWVKLFRLMIAFLSSRALGLEKFSSAKCQLIKDRYGDMRQDICQYLREIWDILGANQIHIIPPLVGSFLELLTVDNKEIKDMGMNLYFSMLEREFKQHRSFKRVERQTIDTLDKIVNEYEEKDQQSFLQVFLSSLKQRFENATEMQEMAIKFMDDMKQLISLFTALRTLPLGPEYDDERTIATIKLMEYFKSTGRSEQYTEYAYQLCERHLSMCNFVEAGFTLLLQADMLDWSDRIVPAIPSRNMPEETSYERKELLYDTIISYFDNGKYWEKAVELLEEMRHQYQNVTFEFSHLADLLEREAKFYRHMVTGERFFAEYFHVGYYGMGFPEDVRNKQFIHRSVEFERLDTFVSCITKRWPDAVLMKTTEPPGPDIKNATGQHLQIYAVKTASLEEMRGERTRLEIERSNQRRYKAYESVKAFLYARPIVRKKNKNDSDFANLWITNNYFETKESFPGVVRRSEIIHQTSIELPPIENAINTIADKNAELEKMIETFSSPGGNSNVSPFTMVLKGVIQAAVNGGVEMYEQAFLNAAYEAQHPDDKDRIQLLRKLLNEQVEVLDRGLKVHQMVVSADMADLQDQLEIGLAQMKNKMKTEKAQYIDIVPGAMAIALPGLTNQHSRLAVSNKSVRPDDKTDLQTSKMNTSVVTSLLTGSGVTSLPSRVPPLNTSAAPPTAAVTPEKLSARDDSHRQEEVVQLRKLSNPKRLSAPLDEYMNKGQGHCGVLTQASAFAAASGGHVQLQAGRGSPAAVRGRGGRGRGF